MNNSAEISVKVPASPARGDFANVKLHPHSLSLPNADDLAFRERIHKQCLALRNDPEEQEWDRWCEAAFAETMKDEPPYEWGN